MATPRTSRVHGVSSSTATSAPSTTSPLASGSSSASPPSTRFSLRSSVFHYGTLPLLPRVRASLSVSSLARCVAKFRAVRALSAQYYTRIDGGSDSAAQAQQQWRISFDEWRALAHEELGLSESLQALYFHRFQALRQLRSNVWVRPGQQLSRSTRSARATAAERAGSVGETSAERRTSSTGADGKSSSSSEGDAQSSLAARYDELVPFFELIVFLFAQLVDTAPRAQGTATSSSHAQTQTPTHNNSSKRSNPKEEEEQDDEEVAGKWWRLRFGLGSAELVYERFVLLNLDLLLALLAHQGLGVTLSTAHAHAPKATAPPGSAGTPSSALMASSGLGVAASLAASLSSASSAALGPGPGGLASASSASSSSQTPLSHLASASTPTSAPSSHSVSLSNSSSSVPPPIATPTPPPPTPSPSPSLTPGSSVPLVDEARSLDRLVVSARDSTDVSWPALRFSPVPPLPSASPSPSSSASSSSESRFSSLLVREAELDALGFLLVAHRHGRRRHRHFSAYFRSVEPAPSLDTSASVSVSVSASSSGNAYSVGSVVSSVQGALLGAREMRSLHHELAAGALSPRAGAALDASRMTLLDLRDALVTRTDSDAIASYAHHRAVPALSSASIVRGASLVPAPAPSAPSATTSGSGGTASASASGASSSKRWVNARAPEELGKLDTPTPTPQASDRPSGGKGSERSSSKRHRTLNDKDTATSAGGNALGSVEEEQSTLTLTLTLTQAQKQGALTLTAATPASTSRSSTKRRDLTRASTVTPERRAPNGTGAGGGGGGESLTVSEASESDSDSDASESDSRSVAPLALTPAGSSAQLTSAVAIAVANTPRHLRQGSSDQLLDTLAEQGAAGTMMAADGDADGEERAGASSEKGEVVVNEVRVLRAQRSTLYLLCALGHVAIVACSDCTIVLGAVAGTIVLEDCVRVRLVAATRAVQLRNCQDCHCNLLTATAPLLLAENAGCVFAPYNTHYAALDRHLRSAGLDTHDNHWSVPVRYTALGARAQLRGDELNSLNLDEDDAPDQALQLFDYALPGLSTRSLPLADASRAPDTLASYTSSFRRLHERELDALQWRIQPPEEFLPFSVPVALTGTTRQNPVPLEAKYAAALSLHVHEFQTLATLLASTSASASATPAASVATSATNAVAASSAQDARILERRVLVETRFREWLQQRGRDREVSALVHAQLRALTSLV